MISTLTQQDHSYLMVLLAGLMPYLFTALAKFGSGRPYNNHDPRDFLSKAEGKHKRANNAQMNSFEAFPLFAVGVLIAHQKLASHHDYLLLNSLSIAFVVTRLTYGWAYLVDLPSLRSVIWFIGIVISCALYLL